MVRIGHGEPNRDDGMRVRVNVLHFLDAGAAG
jgi:hypothetical protein